VLFTIDAADGRHFEHAMSLAEFEAFIAELVEKRRLLKD
jgi:hypothetical protein